MSPIEAAIERVATPPRGLLQVTLDVLRELLPLAGNGTLRFSQPELLTSPRLFVLRPDLGVWVGIMLGPGDWELRAARDDSLPPIAPPKLWVPS